MMENRGSLKRFILQIIEHLLCAAIYVIVAKLGLQLATINANASPVWPATGVAVSLIFLRGYRVAVAIWLGAFIANSWTGLPVGYTAMIAVGNTFEAVLAVYLLNYIRPSLQDKSLYISRASVYSIIALLPTLVSASIGNLALIFAGVLQWQNAWNSFVTWLIGDALGVLFVFPLVKELDAVYRKGKLKECLSLSAEASIWLRRVLAMTTLVVCCYFVFGTSAGNPFLFSIFFGLLGIVLWFPFWAVYVAAIFVSGYSIWMTNLGMGPFRSGETNESLLHLEFFLASIWLTVVILSNLKQTELLKRAAWTFSVGWILTGATFFAFFQSARHASQVDFEARTKEATAGIKSTMESYIRLLEAGASFINSSDLVTAKDWEHFTTGLHFSARFPGLKGLGIVYPISENQVRDFEKLHRKDQSGFTVHEVLDADTSHRGNTSQRFIITLIEPKAGNLPALGLDIGSELKRYSAAVRARDNNETALTRDIRLQQAPNAGPGYLLMLPFYHHGTDVSDLESRRKGLRGFAYAPIEGASFFKFATMGFSKELELKSFDTSPEEESSFAEVPGKIKETHVVLAGVPFRLEWKNKNPNPIQGGLAASMAGFCGAFFTLALAILVAGLEGLGLEARKLADHMTEEVKESEQRWRALTETSPVGVFMASPSSELSYVNSRWKSITGLEFDESKAGQLRERIHPGDKERVLQEWKRLVDKKINDYACHYRLKVNGKWRQIFCHAIEVKSDNGERLGFLGTLQDFTEMSENQAALETASRLSSLGQMAGGIAHEINTPLAVISTKVDLMRMLIARPNFDKTKVDENLAKVHETVHRIAKIVRGLKSIAREPSQETPVLFSVKGAVRDTLELCEKRFVDEGIEFTCIDHLKESDQALGYPEQITQVLLNLLNNSFDAVAKQSNSWVKIVCEKTTESVRIEVSDSGVPITEEVRQSLFNPFFTTKKTGEGTGLGLSISKSIIEKCGGRLYFDSNRTNTTFVVELPYA